MEAQKLIVLSLGKMYASRQKRTGVNLHKNLLVSTVLVKARSQYVTDMERTEDDSKPEDDDEDDTAEDHVVPDQTPSFDMENTIVDLENTSQETVEEETDTTTTLTCARVCKRRLTSEEEEEYQTPPSKRQKNVESYLEPMQTEPVHISSLVNDFNHGFTGLLTSDLSCSTSVKGQSSFATSVSSALIALTV
ncbi:unnamed protein product [Dimorphilus gyrociliatus]|uniref:Uncharacterized protein n=1 Tax=Dimorphilus gyrociliatus TaxID=2664684 RepID=A0A7I8W068_9ANNE|nr:unnamed protein product [Dimorphilus gyrociliatus]